MNFLFAIKLSSDFSKRFKYLQIMRKLNSNSLSFLLLLLDWVTVLAVVREITHIKKGRKTYNFRMKSGMCKRSISDESEHENVYFFTTTFHVISCSFWVFFSVLFFNIEYVSSKITYHSLCLNFFHLLARKPNLEKCSIYSNKFFHNFHLSESSFTCPGLRASGLVRRLYNEV